jgi:hypothetical protein
MNFDYRGTIVSKSTPTPELRTVKKVLHVDSADRDTGIYYTNGEFVVYLPRVYEKVVSLRLMSAEFPPLDFAWQHAYSSGSNIASAVFSNDSSLLASANAITPNYFLVDIDGLNKGDETAVSSQRSQHTDSFYAKIATTTTSKSGYAPTGTVTATNLPAGSLIEYNDNSSMENISHFSPPIGKMDRLRIRSRLHSQQGSQGFIYWSSSNATASFTLVGANSTSQGFSSLTGAPLVPGMVLAGANVTGTVIVTAIGFSNATSGTLTLNTAVNTTNTTYTASALSTATATSSNTNNANYCMTFEIEYLDNGFDQFSSMSTHLRPNDRA